MSSATMDETFKETSSQTRSACTECQRRKQKCNREWPCNHCQKRKVADKCRFNQPGANQEKAAQEAKKTSQTPPTESLANTHQEEIIQPSERIEPQPAIPIATTTTTTTTTKKRQLNRDDYDEGGESDEDDDDELGIGNIGYMATHQFASLGLEGKKEKHTARLYSAKESANSHLKRALDLLPNRSHIDAMVQNFFDNVNYHYYIIYPPVFLQEYKEWWVKRKQGRPLSLQWTCLLFTVCACACQHLPVDVQEKLEKEIGETASQLSERYHNAARELGSAIPVGYYHMYNVQWLLHSTYWFKAEARFLECWFVVGAAAREAQELGFHKKEAAEHLPEFDREMRRRVWCVIDCWDWQISSGLFRPTIIDHTDCTVELPTLTLEDFSPSPLMHMKLQSELIHQLAARFGAPKNISSTTDVQVYKGIIDTWMQKFPPAYALENPDTSGDEERPWIRFHRHYIHTMGYMMLLNPIRPFMALTFTNKSPYDELAVRAVGVDYALRQMDVLRDWVDFVSYRDGRFHFIIFALFDTSAVLSTALIKDEAGTIPSRNDIYDMIDSAVIMLKDLMVLSPTAKMSYDILSRIVRKVPRPNDFRRGAMRKRYKSPQLSYAQGPYQGSVTAPVPGLNYQPMPTFIHQPVHAPPPPVVYAPPPTVYAPPPPPVQASPPMHASVHAPVHAPLQPSVHAPVQSSIHVPVQPPHPPQVSVTAPPPSQYVPQNVGAEQSTVYVPPAYVYAATPPSSHIHPSDNVTALSSPQSDTSGYHGAPYSTASDRSGPSSVDGNIGSPDSSVNSLGMDEGSISESSPQGSDASQFDTITDAELGELATLWNWQSLNLPFISSEAAGVAQP